MGVIHMILVAMVVSSSARNTEEETLKTSEENDDNHRHNEVIENQDQGDNSEAKDLHDYNEDSQHQGTEGLSQEPESINQGEADASREIALDSEENEDSQETNEEQTKTEDENEAKNQENAANEDDNELQEDQENSQLENKELGQRDPEENSDATEDELTEAGSEEKEKNSPKPWGSRRRRWINIRRRRRRWINIRRRRRRWINIRRRRRRWINIRRRCGRRRSGPSGKYTTHSTPRPQDWIPVLYFDRYAGRYCFPDEAKDSHDNRCLKFNSNAPIYYATQSCNANKFKIAYWFWYGLQKCCICTLWKKYGQHGNDWEHIVLTFNRRWGRWYLDTTAFYQHAGHYTRRVGTFGMEGNRVIVYVGRIAHGSYHEGCNGNFFKGKCMSYCPGGCGYWDDRRDNNGRYRLRSRNLKKLSDVTGKVARDGGNYCTERNCNGKNKRDLYTSGCWQNNV